MIISFDSLFYPYGNKVTQTKGLAHSISIREIIVSNLIEFS